MAMIADWKRRLLALDAQTRFAGYPASAIAAAEARLGVAFPPDFRSYLEEMGLEHGELLVGSDLAAPDQLESFREDALELLAETDPSLTLPPQAIVFLFHQGYQFAYLLDGKVWLWVEDELEPKQIHDSFDGFVSAELDLMEEVSSR